MSTSAAPEGARSACFVPLAALCGAAFLLIAYALAFAVVGVHLGFVNPKTFAQHPMPIGMYALALSYIPLIAYFLYVMPRATRRTLRQIGFRPPTPRSLVFAAAGAAVLVACSELFTRYSQPTDSGGSFLSFGSGPIYLTTYFVMSIILAPIAEEMAFRVLLFGSLSRVSPAWFAAVASGLVFAAVHGPSSDMAVLTALGIALAVIYARTKNIWAAIIMHGLFNLGGIMLIAL